MDIFALYLLLGLIGGLCIYATWRLTLQKDGLGLFDPLACFLLPFLIINVFQPISYLDVFESWSDRGIIIRTLFEVLVGLLFVLVSFWFGAGPKLALAFPGAFRLVSRPRLSLLALVTTAIGIVGWGLQIYLAGGFEVWSATARGGTQYEEIPGYVLLVGDLVYIGLLVGLVTSELERNGQLRNIFLILALLALAWCVYIGSRSRTIFMLFIIGASYYLPRARHPGLWPILALPPLAILSNLLTEVRGAFRDFTFYVDEVDLQDAITKSLIFSGSDTAKTVTPAMDFNVILTVVNLVPDTVSYAWGYPLLEIFTRPIPRMFWDDKIYPMLESFFPIFATGMLSAMPVEYGKTELLMSPAMPFIGFWHLNGGVLGVIVGSVLTGMLLRAISEVFRNQEIGKEYRICVVILLGFQIGFTEGAATPLHWAFSVPLHFLVLYFVFKASSRNVPQSEPFSDRTTISLRST